MNHVSEPPSPSAADSDGAPSGRDQPSLYRLLWQHGSNHRTWLVAALSCLCLGEGLRLVVPWLAAQAINVLQRQGWQGADEALHWLLTMFACLVGVWLFYGPGRLLERHYALHVRSRHADSLLGKLLAAPLQWHESHHTGDLSQRFFASTHALFHFSQEQYQYVQCVVLLIGPVLALTLIHPVLGLVALCGYALIVLASLRMDRRIATLMQQSNEAEYRYSAGLYDVLANILTIMALRREAGSRQLLAQRLEKVFQPLRSVFLWQEGKWALIDMTANALWCLLLGLHVWLTQSSSVGSTLAMGTLFMVYQYARQADGVVGQLVSQLAAVTQRRVDVSGQTPIDHAPVDLPVATSAPTSWQSLLAAGLWLQHAEQPVLQGVSLQLQRGQRYALVGPSGAGKTSLLRVLAGLERASGELRLDQQVINAPQLRRLSTLVPQNHQMFFGSVRDNLQLGSDSDDALLWSMLTLAQAEPALTSHHDGLESMVHEGGSNWSGGERQRLALARGLLAAHDSSLWLFDEPTSHLDAHSERKVFQSLMAAAQQRCVVVAVHRLSLLDMVDQVIVMQAGRVVDVGTRADLLIRCGLFQQLNAGQLNDAAI